MASESTRLWCVAESRAAMRDAPRATEAEQGSHGGVKRAGHLRDQHPHLAALGERIGVLTLCGAT